MFCIEQHCQVGLGVCCGIASSETKASTWMNTCAWLDCTATHRFTTPVFIFIWRILGSCGAMISTCLTANTSWYGLQKRRLLLSLCKLLRSRIQYQARPSTAAAASKSAFQHGADTVLKIKMTQLTRRLTVLVCGQRSVYDNYTNSGEHSVCRCFETLVIKDNGNANHTGMTVILTCSAVFYMIPFILPMCRLIIPCSLIQAI